MQHLKNRLSSILLIILVSISSFGITEPQHTFEPLIRARYASLEDNSQNGSAASILLRGRLKSEWSMMVSTLLEIDYVESFRQDEHSDGVRFNDQPEIPDVPGTDLNQALIIFGVQDWRFHFGRQVLSMDNERFIGSVSAWQNEQTFDAAFVDGKILSRSAVKYAYIAQANRIFGRDASPNLQADDINFTALAGRRPLTSLGRHEHQTHWLSAEFKEWDYWELGAFGLLIDNEDVPALSSNTWGIRFAAQYKPNRIQWRLESEVAAQQYDNSNDWIPYYRLQAGFEINTHEVSINQESLDASNGRGFTTSLGTNHDFQGWADVFNTLPTDGLRDAFLKYTWRGKPWKIDLRWHHFATLNNSHSLGYEVDADIILKINQQQFLLRIAHYQADTDSGPGVNDRQRVILSYTAKF